MSTAPRSRALAVAAAAAAALALAVTGPAARAATIFAQDFSAGLGANESAAGNFSVNTSGYGGNGTARMGHADGYTDAEYSYYQISNLDLTGHTDARLQFNYWGYFETHFDRFNVLASTGPFSPPAGLLTPDPTSDMRFVEQSDVHHPDLGTRAYDSGGETGGNAGVAVFDLSAFAGSVINLRFQFGSDESVTSSGFSLDDVLITSAPPPPQANTAVPLPSAAGGALLLMTALATKRLRRHQPA